MTRDQSGGEGMASKSKMQACVGWVMNQLGPGNNIGLRMLALTGGPIDAGAMVLDGPQHESIDAMCATAEEE